MSNAPEVDFSQIRGDWHFHIDYLSNAVEQTLVRVLKLLPKVKDDVGSDISALVQKQSEVWTQFRKDRDPKGSINVANPLLDEFFALAKQTKAPCDAFEEAKGLGGSSSVYDNTLEQFTESVRQLRSFVDDLAMMREQRPDQ